MLEKVIQLPECLSNVRKALFKLCSASCSTKTDGFACKPNAWRMGQEDQEFEVILGYIESWRPAWATSWPSSQYNNNKSKTERGQAPLYYN